NDSLTTCTCSVSTAQSIACRNPEVVEMSLLLKTLSATSEAPGATPWILMLQAVPGDWAPNPATWYTCLPCPPIALASMNASPPSVGAAVPSPGESAEVLMT